MGVLSEYIAKKVFPECKKLKYVLQTYSNIENYRKRYLFLCIKNDIIYLWKN
jgi:hypothetical protein